MDSINKNQPEENREDLNSLKAIEKMKALIGKSASCFFCTANPLSESNGVRPMSVQKVDDDGVLWFLSANDSHKNEEISIDSAVRLYFQGSSHSDYLFLKGEAGITRDKNKIKELWEPVLKTWFTDGENDPRISVIRFTPEEGYYWDTKHGNAVAAVKMLFGAVTGQTLDDSIEGKLNV